MIPGLSNTVTVALFGVGTAIFVFSMAMFYKGLRAKKKAKQQEV